MKEFKDFTLKKPYDGRKEHPSDIRKVSRRDIAIIGIAVKLPMADNINEFWNNIRSGRDCIRGISKERQEDCDRYLYFLNKSLMDIQYEDGASIDDVDKFDYEFFHISPKEASLMDPNQRLFLETTWSALEDSGYIGQKVKESRTGVFLGFASDPEYKNMIGNTNPELLSTALPGNISSIIASRISYLLDLRGPSMLINTACSSSLVAVHQACQSIRNDECDMAVAGGVQVHLLPFRKIKVGVESSNMRTRTFDMASDGTGAGEGVISLVLKPLYMAERDRDNIYAVIKGSAINQDGSSVGITAPNAKAQASVIVSAWKDAGVDPDTITYIEAHGTGTKLGDPIEIDAINMAFGRFTSRKQFCAVSSVKSNIGHLDNSSGLAGLLKAVLSLKNKELAPSLHFNRPNEKIDFANSPVYVNNELQEWDVGSSPRRCGVSSFGMSGTNCHIVLEEYCQEQNSGTISEGKSYILALSAKSRYSLIELIKRYLNYFTTIKEESISNICYTSCTAREHYNLRLAVILKDAESFVSRFSRLNLETESFTDIKGVFFGEHKLVFNESEKINPEDITEKDKIKLISTADIEIKEDREANLAEICRLYTAGADINWEALNFECPAKKAALPTYPFKRTRCWLDIPQVDICNAETRINDIFHTTKWEKEALHLSKGKGKVGKALIIKTGSLVSDRLADKLRMNYEEVIEADISDGFKKISDCKYCISNRKEDFAKLFELLKNEGIRQVIHAVMLSDGIECSELYQLQERQTLGLYSLMNVIKGIAGNEIKDELRIALITDYAHYVNAEQKSVIPENSMISGMAKSIKWEYPNISCKCIDMDSNTDICRIAEEIAEETSGFAVAYRNNRRYAEKVIQVEPGINGLKTEKIKENGTYLITGGVGRIGLEMAKYLASKKRVNLVLVNRSEFPERNEWDMILRDKPGDIQAGRIKEIKYIESTGSLVTTYSADISNEKQLKYVMDKIRNEFGRIDGVIHGAGIGVGLKGVSVDKDTEEVYEQILLPKVKGTWLLNKLTELDEPDFFVMFSSAITLIGGVGSGSYTAANYYLDSFASYMASKGRNALTINWSAWNKDKLVEKLQINEDRQIIKIISPDMGVRAFDRALHSAFNRLIVGKFNYGGSLFDMQELLPFTFEEKIASGIKRERELYNSWNKKNEEKPRETKLIGRNKGIYSDTEKIIANVWREVLGFDEININSNFFEIGGDSILLVKAQKLMEIEFPGKVKLQDFFAYPTISKLAKFIIGSDEAEDRTERNMPGPKTDSKEEIYKLIKDIESGNVDIENAVNIYSGLEGNHGE